MKRNWWCYLLLVGGVLFHLSCDLTDPSHLDRPPILTSFQPEAKEVRAFLGDTLQFNICAADPDGKGLQSRFLLGDSVVSLSDSWVYVVEDTGLVTVKGSVTDGSESLEVLWQLERDQPENLPPVIQSYDPPVLNPVMIINHQLDFKLLAEDPDGLPISYFYKIADSVVSTSRHFSFLPNKLGETDITAYATDGEKYSWIKWHVRVTNNPDTIPPAAVDIVSLETGVEPGEINVSWIAVGENGMEGLPSYYQVRTSKTPIIDEYSWQRASDRPGEPPPAPPGEIQQMVIRDMNPADSVYVSIRAVDEFSNWSPLGECLVAKAKGQEVFGLIRNSITGEPIEGIELLIGLERAVTGPDGWFRFDALPLYTGIVYVADEKDPSNRGDYFNLQFPYTVQHDDSLYLWLIPNFDLDTDIYDDFFLFFRQMTDTYNNNFGNILRRWELPLDFYIEPYVHNDLDYAAVIEGVLDEFEALTGLDLFNIVDSPPDVGVRIEYQVDLYADNYSVELYTSDLKMPIKGLITFRTVYDPSSQWIFEKIIRHEVGHALGIKHSIDREHLMYGGVDINTKITHMTRDEMAVLHSMYNIPRMYLINNYKDN